MPLIEEIQIISEDVVLNDNTSRNTPRNYFLPSTIRHFPPPPPPPTPPPPPIPLPLPFPLPHPHPST